jgi:ketosteroid isomerase-like protein
MTPDLGGAMQSQNIAALFFKLVNQRDMTAFEKLLADNAKFYFPKTKPLLGKERVLRFFNILFKRFPKLEFKVERTVVQGSTVVVHWTNQGLRKDQQPYDNEGVTWLEIKDGKVILISDFFKDTGKF